MEPEGSLPQLQVPPPMSVLSQLDPVQTPTFHFLKWQYRKSTIHNKLNNIELGSKNETQVTNNTPSTLTIIIPIIKWAQPNPNMTTARSLTL